MDDADVAAVYYLVFISYFIHIIPTGKRVPEFLISSPTNIRTSNECNQFSCRQPGYNNIIYYIKGFGLTN